MENLPFRHKRKTVFFTRLFVISIVIFSLTLGGFPTPANAAVPTWVVLFDANTAFETSLETFMFDLFNTLQRRQEDFTAAFELQKIEKAREDVNKLFQETQEELQNAGLLLNSPPQGGQCGNGIDDDGDGLIDFGATPTNDPDCSSSNDREAPSPRDPRFTGKTGQNCETSGNAPGCPPLISPIKDSRIIHDPYQYLFGDAYTKAQLYLYCYFNYLIWDQQGLLGTAGPSSGYAFLNNKTVLGVTDWYNKPKRTYDPIPSDPPGLQDPIGVERSIKQLKRIRNTLVVQFHRGNYYLLNYPLQVIYGDVSPGKFDQVEPRCRQVMYTVGAESPVTIEQNVGLWADLMKGNNAWKDAGNQALVNQETQEFRQSIWFLPTLPRSIARRAPNDPWSWAEYERATDKTNTLNGVSQIALATARRIIDETQTEREATYIAGQGFRPENLYTSEDEGSAHFEFNTEYVIAPAAILLQKMQAATQAMFDLAGQGFLYLDPDDSPQDLLAKYRLATTATQAAERRICNQAGSCALLDPWLKPAASFRTAASLQDSWIDNNGNNILDASEQPSFTRTPVLVGPAIDYANTRGNYKSKAGSGLPAPWEDYADFLNISNEKSPGVDNPGSNSASLNPGIANDRRYTISRFRVFNRSFNEDATSTNTAGRDEFDDLGITKNQRFRDNIGWPNIGQDFPVNDWYDRVFEMYEPGIGTFSEGALTSQRPARLRDFTIQDWQCYVATWFNPQNFSSGGNGTYFVGGKPVFPSGGGLTTPLEQYCRIIP